MWCLFFMLFRYTLSLRLGVFLDAEVPKLFRLDLLGMILAL